MGTPDFAAASLEKLIEKKANVVAVLTAPDKPAGRGLQLQKSAVKIVAEKAGLKILQPEKLKNPEFLETLRELEIDLGIVVAFRMLPEVVWQMPRLGTFNLHGSLLPKYRGAAPIHWAIMNGETETGITTFFLKHEIDTGKILFQEKLAIGPDENVGSLYTKMMNQGADLVWKTVESIAEIRYYETDQDEASVIHAPKIFRETCRLDFAKNAQEVHNKVRGLSPVPAAWCDFEEKNLKIFETRLSNMSSMDFGSGQFRVIDGGLFVSTQNEWLEILVLQPEGKRRMLAKEFLAGHKIEKL